VLTLSKKSNTSSLFFKKLVLKHLKQLEVIAEKRFVDPNLTQESIMYALEKLEEKNWLADSYNNKSSRFTTYLITVFKNILEDFARMKFGRPQVPKWVKAGLVNLILYRLINMLVRNLRFSCRFPLK